MSKRNFDYEEGSENPPLKKIQLEPIGFNPTTALNYLNAENTTQLAVGLQGTSNYAKAEIQNEMLIKLKEFQNAYQQIEERKNDIDTYLIETRKELKAFLKLQKQYLSDFSRSN